MLKPIPIIFDGNLFLNSISSAILGNLDDKDVIFQSKNTDPMKRGRGMLIKTFIQTYFSTIEAVRKKGYSITHSAIVWDRKLEGKYYKTSILDKLNDGSTYKSDRKFVSEDDLDDESLTDDERKVIEASLCRSTEFLKARRFLQDNLPTYGIPNVSLPGWEADDLDYVWGLETNKREGLHIHCSGDSDWQFHLTNNDVHYQPGRGGKVYVKTESTVREKFNILDEYGLMEWASIEFSALGSHNNLLRTIDPSIKRFTKKYRKKMYEDKDFSMIGDLSRFNAQKQVFDILSFPGLDTVKALYEEVLKVTPSSDESKFSNFLLKVGINSKDKAILRNKYSSYKSAILNSKLNQLDI